jgi:hypothetical protein
MNLGYDVKSTRLEEKKKGKKGEGEDTRRKERVYRRGATHR